MHIALGCEEQRQVYIKNSKTERIRSTGSFFILHESPTWLTLSIVDDWFIFNYCWLVNDECLWVCLVFSVLVKIFLTNQRELNWKWTNHQQCWEWVINDKKRTRWPDCYSTVLTQWVSKINIKIWIKRFNGSASPVMAVWDHVPKREQWDVSQNQISQSDLWNNFDCSFVTNSIPRPRTA